MLKDLTAVPLLRGGGTNHRLKEWKKVTHDPVILGFTQGVRVDFEGWPTQRDSLEEFRHSEKSRKLISEELKVLTDKGVLEVESEG